MSPMSRIPSSTEGARGDNTIEQEGNAQFATEYNQLKLYMHVIAKIESHIASVYI